MTYLGLVLSERGDIWLMGCLSKPKKRDKSNDLPRFLKSERGDSNARPLRPERSALPTALLSDCGAKLRTFYERSKFIAPKTCFYAKISIDLIS